MRWFVIIKQVIAVIVLLAAGWTMNIIYADLGAARITDTVVSTAAKTESTLPTLLFSEPKELPNPSDRIKEDQIHVYQDKVVIDVPNPEWASFTATHSMDPVFDVGSNAIEIVPKSPDEIRVGDIVSYESKYASGTIIHRVVEIGNDTNGWYCRLKGDNVDTIDPGKVRFDQLRRVVVAIIY